MAAVQIFVVDCGRDPDGSCSHALDIGELLLDACQIAAPIGLPLGVGRVKQAGAFSRVVIGGVAVEEAIGNHLIDDLFLEVLRVNDGAGSQPLPSPAPGKRHSTRSARQKC